jgi:diaminohydroxyphosphoribosylaminopyrimidine deaminase/5-amino-6-(5-phosphoribosylamino)uracil reductase
MERAFALAERGRGATSPNPLVGAVVVRDGAVIGEGWHERAGEAHAEVNALRVAGDATRGATMYVTLEPCTHHGRTPPCVDAVIDAGIERVFVGAVDADPRVRGAGVERLREAGVDVTLDERWEARALNAGYFSVLERGRPWVILKVATTLEGAFAVPGRRWVTGDLARRHVHELRAWVDAVAVGMGTVRADAPRLDARAVNALKQPRRLAFGRGPLPDGSALELRSGPLDAELVSLAEEGVQTLLLEGGPTLAAAFFAGGLVDELRWFVAPVLGGAPHGLALPELVDLRHVSFDRVGNDVVVSGYVREP